MTPTPLGWPGEGPRISKGGPFTRFVLLGVVVVLPLALLAWLAVGFGSALWNWGAGLVGLAESLGIEGTLPVLGFALGMVVVLLAGLALVGVATSHRRGGWIVDLVDSLILRIPGLGPLYGEFRRTRALIAPDGDRSFREVVLVELSDDVHVLGFVVTSTSPDVSADLREDANWTTVYMPLAPNPLVGGHLVHVSEDRLSAVDLAVRQALSRLGTLDADEIGAGEGAALVVDGEGTAVEGGAPLGEVFEGIRK